MKKSAIQSLACLAIIFMVFNASAVGLQEYLQNTEATTEAVTQSPSLASVNEATTQLTHIIELVVAGIVAAALIISVLVLFLGRWLAKKEKKIIKEIRIEAEQDKENITSAATTIREQEKESTKLVHEIRSQATEISTQREENLQYTQSIASTSEKVKAQEKELLEVTDHVSNRMDDIQSYWDDQLKSTVEIIGQVQERLDKNLITVDNDLGKIHHQKKLSQELLQDFLNKHNEQSTALDSNSEISDQVNSNLKQTLKESQKLIDTLLKYQKEAEKSLKNYNDKLNTFEEQAYEQFDTSFQVADLARQELNANIDESRKHVETMRRHEQQSHGISAQTMKHLESLDYSKIVKISNTLDSTQNMFDDIHNKVEETRYMLDELKEIESDIKKTANKVEHAIAIKEQQSLPQDVELESLESKVDSDISEDAGEFISEELLSVEAPQSPLKETKDNTTIEIAKYKMASEDDQPTPLSFFRNIKQQEK
ncbi:hypothetical protein GCM10009133_23870 [Cocleimonas flava]|uniref:Uncharacterized protein n=1 Tax=Cocleimonas flava TaxID=634765 RepID=A0A4R1EY35_9GAMM|nr:hypothetical protein [Cocleimonas flava]TCJ82921.1 hypothetical protein EV695_3659 [Cocleimonas flava]